MLIDTEFKKKKKRNNRNKKIHFCEFEVETIFVMVFNACNPDKFNIKIIIYYCYILSRHDYQRKQIRFIYFEAIMVQHLF